MKTDFRLPLALATMILSNTVFAAPVLLSPEWGTEACNAWNQDPVLTEQLVKSRWISNDKGRGFKVVQIYRSDCPNSPHIELRLSQKEKLAQCVYGGKAETTALAPDADYVMYAETTRWNEMGKGDYGPMKAMMFGRLKFEGPKTEAMANMGPFSSFLLLVGKVPADSGQCPGA
jgi:putative sterol carrier protein